MLRSHNVLIRLFLLLHLIFGTVAQLPAQLNANLAANNKFVYTLNAQFEDDIQADWSNEDITMLAQQAYVRMVSKFPADKRLHPRFKNQSPVMTAIVVGHSVYFSSSLTGGGSLQYVPNQNCGYRDRWTPGNPAQPSPCALVYEALLACQLRSPNNSGHRSGGNCGEVMAATSFCTVNPDGNLAGAKIVTWGLSRGVQSVWNPCMPEPNDLASMDVWGCDSFVKKLSMVAILPDTNPSNRAIPNFTPTYSPFT
ncbi:MAG: hypothetical protein ASARMPRED_000604 [Alectoria sarmentosa]|nr:MAG: hypothetical protein ASARMPRED_000604 [Alectoria sarmentosa]